MMAQEILWNRSLDLCQALERRGTLRPKETANSLACSFQQFLFAGKANFWMPRAADKHCKQDVPIRCAIWKDRGGINDSQNRTAFARWNERAEPFGNGSELFFLVSQMCDRD